VRQHHCMHFERARGLGDLKRGIRGRLCFASSQLQADRNSSPLVPLLNKKKFINLIKLTFQILKFH
ncbi:hypothetical protein, partial [Campylobacter concisus]|uniref:hypothetical protein n=1 Tax=Campylobacter concisus TaxID=199 RepID=UPI001CA5E821